MLSKFFRPKWQHADPAVRATAARKLREDNPAHVQILTRLATEDPVADVRIIAASQITDIDQLILLLGGQQTHLSAIEQQLIGQLEQSADPAPAFDKLIKSQNQERAFQILCSCGHGELIATLFRNASQPQLVQLAISPAPIHLRKDAAEKITHPELIDELLKLTRQSDKTIHKIMRDKLTASKERERQARQHRELAQDITSQMLQLSEGEWFPLYAAKFQSLITAWESLPESIALIQEASTFEAAAQLCQQRVQQQLEAANTQANALAEKQQSLTNADKLIAQLDNLTEQCSPFDINCINDIQAQWLYIQNSWKQLPHTTNSQTTRFNRSEQFILSVLDHAATREQKISRATDCLNVQLNKKIEELNSQQLKQKQKEIQQVLAQLKWPSFDPVPEQIDQLSAVANRIQSLIQRNREQQATAEQALKTQISQLELAINTGEARQADKLVKKLNDQLKQSAHNISPSHEIKLRQLNLQLQELKDWQGYAVTPKKEQLCTEMEQLAAQDSIPAADKSQLIKQLQRQWKLLDATDPVHSSLLWKRFKAASDLAYEPCEAYFSQQRELRAYNLTQRELIVSEVSQYLQLVDWEQTHWRDIETVITAAKREWRRFIPVDRNPGQAIQQQFNELIVATESRFKVIKEASLIAKEAIIADAHLLTNHDDPVSAAEQAKTLQDQWKDAGPTFHSQERKLWKRFRTECDKIFARLTEHQQTQRSSENPRVKLAEYTQILQAFASKPQAIEPALQALEHGSDLLAEVTSLPARDVSQFKKAAQLITEQLTALDRLESQISDSKLQQATKFFDQLEEQILSGAELPASPIEWTLNSTALSEQLLDNLAKRAEVINGLIESQSTEVDNDIWAKSDRALREICIRLEIALGLSTPEEDQAIRMEYQMQRLQQMLDQPTQPTTLIDIRLLELEWYTIPFNQTFDELFERFDAIIGSIFDN